MKIHPVAIHLFFLLSWVAPLNDYFFNSGVLNSQTKGSLGTINKYSRNTDGKLLYDNIDDFNIESLLCTNPSCYNKLFKSTFGKLKPTEGVRISYTLQPNTARQNIILKQSGMRLRTNDNVDQPFPNIPDTPIEGMGINLTL
jgi:hypothetical protein